MTASTIPSCHGCGGHCCTAYVVPLTGYDVWELSRVLQTAPEQFVRREPEDYPTDTGFVLSAAGPTYGLALRYDDAASGERPCMFLLPAVNGARLCRIYAHRPLACQAYPIRLAHGAVAPRPDMLCPPGSWAGWLAGAAGWGDLLLRQDRAWQSYVRVVAAWNAAVRGQATPAGYVLAEFLIFVVQAYQAFAYLQSLDENTPPGEFELSLRAFASAWLAGP